MKSSFVVRFVQRHILVFIIGLGFVSFTSCEGGKFAERVDSKSALSEIKDSIEALTLTNQKINHSENTDLEFVLDNALAEYLVAVTSSNTDLLPDSGVQFESSSDKLTISVDPVDNKTGEAVLTLVFDVGETLIEKQATLAVEGVDLLVPITIGSLPPISSDTQVNTFEGTRTPVDLANYDGVVETYWSASVYNGDPVDHTIEVIDSSGNVVGSMLVPATGGTFQHLRGTWTPNPGSDNYRIRVPQTVSWVQVQVINPTLFIRQVDATKTQLMFPFFHSGMLFYTGCSFTASCPVDKTTSLSYTQVNLHEYGIFPREDQLYPGLATGGGAWKFEAVLANANASNTASAALFDNTGTVVDATELSHTGSTPTLVSVDLSGQETGFGSGMDFHVRIKSSHATNAQIYRAALWWKIESLSRARLYQSIGSSSLDAPQGVTEDSLSRIHYVSSNYSNPVVRLSYLDTVPAGVSVTRSLMDQGANTSGTNGALSIYDDDPGTNYVRQRSLSAPLTGLSPDAHYFIQFETSSAGYDIHSAFFNIDVSPKN